MDTTPISFLQIQEQNARNEDHEAVVQAFLDSAEPSLDDVAPENTSRRQQSGMSKTVRLAWTVVDRIPAAMTAENMTAGELSSMLVSKFNHLHPIDAFYPGQEPQPGTYRCRFCELSLEGLEASEHSRGCAKLVMLNTTLEKLNLVNVPPRCTWSNENNQQCPTENFPDLRAWSIHVEQHFIYRRTTHGATLCRLEPCNDTLLTDTESLVEHMILAHGIPLVSKSGHMADRLVKWCGTCGRWISQMTNKLNEHAANHAELVHEIVKAYGYCGVQTSARNAIPAFNPFSIHDINLSPWHRYLTYINPEKCAEAVARDTRDLRQGPWTCPASHGVAATCADSSYLSKGGLLAHLKNQHGFKFYKGALSVVEEAADEEGKDDTSKQLQKTRKRKSAIVIDPMAPNKRVLSMLAAEGSENQVEDEI